MTNKNLEIKTFKDFFEKAEPIKSKELGKIIADFQGHNIYERKVKLMKADFRESGAYAVIISDDGYCLKNNKIVESKPEAIELKYFGFLENEALNEFNKVVEQDRILKN